jgi:predicted nucleic acid-binding protein
LILFDTSVVLDARDPDSPFHAWARNKIAEAAAGDGAAANTVVISESSVRSKNPEAVPSKEIQGILSSTARLNQPGSRSVFSSMTRPSVISASQVCLRSALSVEMLASINFIRVQVYPQQLSAKV